ncbi:MAG: hypothetical protein MI741_08855 [Rhodospirillales bacterium]|nr:hypothetical protein [Rhodospirillales bacterium]
MMKRPDIDSDFSKRIAYLKKEFTKGWLATGGGEKRRTQSQLRNRRHSVWQRRFWEPFCRGEDDTRVHLEYVHFNPVKHGLVPRSRDWPYSSFHRYVRQGAYQLHWGCALTDSAQRETFTRIERRVEFGEPG